MPESFDYHRYLASREWAALKKAVRERAAGLCERCGLLPIGSVHHLTYERLGREELNDLRGLCKPCHAFESAATDFDPRLWFVEAGQLAIVYVNADYGDVERQALIDKARELAHRFDYQQCRIASLQASLILEEYFGSPPDRVADPRFVLVFAIEDEARKVRGDPLAWRGE